MFIKEKLTKVIRKVHEIKILENYYQKVLIEEKTFELRKNDRQYQVGDILKFKVIDNNKNEIKYPLILYVITYILKDPLKVSGLEKDYVIMSIKKYCEDFEYLETINQNTFSFFESLKKEKELKHEKIIQEVKTFLLEKCINENGDLDISGLDFSDFNGDIIIGNMKVKNDLYQNNQVVGNNLIQSNQNVEGELFQRNQQVGRSLYQNFQKVGASIDQSNQVVKYNIFQNNQKFLCLFPQKGEKIENVNNNLGE